LLGRSTIPNLQSYLQKKGANSEKLGLGIDNPWRIFLIDFRLRSTIPNLQMYLAKKANSEKLGLGIDNPCRMIFFEFADEQVLVEG
jgi:hypothetical protein